MSRTHMAFQLYVLPGTLVTFFTSERFFCGLKCRRTEVFVLRFIKNPNSRLQILNPDFPIERTQPAIAPTVPGCLCHMLSFQFSSLFSELSALNFSTFLKIGTFYSNLKVCRFELFCLVSSVHRIYKVL